MMLSDLLVALVAFTLSIIVRWIIFSGPNWGRTLLKILSISVVPVMYKLMRGNFIQETLIILCIFVVASILVWLARWPTNWLIYTFKVFRGVAKAAEVKADAYAGVTSGMKSSVDSPPGVPPNTDEIYAEIAAELDTHNVETGLWTRLYAECNGDETKTKVRYIKERASKLSEKRQGQTTQHNDSEHFDAMPMGRATLAPTLELSPKERDRAMAEMIKRMK